jgi:hypothetical protein
MFLPEAPFEFVADESDAAEQFAALRVTTRGGEVAGKILIDRATWLPKSMQLLIPSGSITELSEYQQAAGRFIPATVIVNQASGEKSTFVMKHATAKDSLDMDELAYPSGMPSNFVFDRSAPAALDLKLAPSGHLLVNVQLDGGEPVRFILDTGAGSLGVNTSYAKERNLKGFGRVNVQGIGGSAISQFRLAKSLKVGPLTLQDPILVEIDLDFLEQYMGVPIAGILGFELFSRCVAEVDFVAPKVELFDATEYELAQGTSWNELFYIDRLPAIEAEFEESGKGIFKLDTGAAGSTLMFHSPAVKHFKLLEGRETSTSQTGGVGGAVSVEMGPLSSFRFGGHEVKDQQVGFAIGEGDGAFSDEASAGNIGGVWLRPFTLVLDYPQKRIAFVKKPE